MHVLSTAASEVFHNYYFKFCFFFVPISRQMERKEYCSQINVYL